MLGLTVSSVGHGSYLGALDEAARQGYRDATAAALAGGINLLDTASSYREQASERDVGDGIRAYLASGGRRDGFLVVTKAGFLHGDVDEVDAEAWFQREYVDSGVIAKGDILSSHCMTPSFVRHQVARSRRNLGLATLDAVLLHNVEHPLEWGVAETTYYAAVENAFLALEQEVDAGHLQSYGVATWDGFRVPPGTKGHLSLVKLVHAAGQARMRADQAAGHTPKAGQHHFRAIELPVNLAMAEAALVPTQPFRFGAQTILDSARELGMLVLASASLGQMRMRLDPELLGAFEAPTAAQAAMQFTRSVPGVTTALVGMGHPAHAVANAEFACARAPEPGTVKTLLGTGSIHGA
jgi:aryl-alcohol dehydrogenase-like predicted oxidoreductase